MNFDILSTDISNTIVKSKWFVSPKSLNHLLFKHFILKYLKNLDI